jgi:hypothetical protein
MSASPQPSARFGDIALMHTAISLRSRDEAGESWDMSITEEILPYFADSGIECVTMSHLYDDLIREQHNSAGCQLGMGQSPTRVCLD